MQHNLNQASFCLMPWDYPSNRIFGRLCENFQIESPSMFSVINWPKLIGALLQLKLQSINLPDGELIIGIENYGNIAIRVTEGNAYCENTNSPANVHADRLTITRMIFGPFPPEVTITYNRKYSLYINAWFPLPLSWYPQDNV